MEVNGLNKNKLDIKKTAAITFPLEWYIIIDSKICERVDKMCRKCHLRKILLK